MVSFSNRRKKVARLADQEWGEELPKFNNEREKNRLDEFVERILPEAELKEVNFLFDGIRQHVRDHFNELRRSLKISFWCRSEPEN